MFSSLKLKLTIINTALVALIILIISSGIYLFMQASMQKESEQILLRAARERRMPVMLKINNARGGWLNHIVVRVGPDYHLVDISPNHSYTEEESSELVNRVKSQTKEMGIIRIKDESFRFLQAGLRNTEGKTLVFLSAAPEREILSRLLLILIIVGLCSIALVFFTSLFFASKAIKPVKEAWERQKAFTADASHELRTPLAIISTNLDIVMSSSEDRVESQMEWLSNIQTGYKKMASLVDDLLLLARYDANHTMKHKSVFHLAESIKNAIKPFLPIASRKSIHLDFTIKDSISFYGSEKRIRQLVYIHLDNAIQYTLKGGEIKVRIDVKNDEAELIVSDTGIGISGEHIDKIFQRFYRVDKARSSKDHSGTGLGLSIADCIIKEHHGKITVASILGKGSIFKVSLPLY